MSEWKTYRLGDIIQLKSGGTPDKSNPDYWGGSIPWISAKSMYDDFISTSDLFITEEGLQAGSKIAKKDSILLLTRGSGLFNRIPVCYVVSDVAYNQDVKNIVLKQEDVTSIKFLYYWLYGNKELLSSMLETTGIGAGKIDTKRFLNLSISLPSQKEQARYIHVMDLLFDKIELNRRINANLEAQAQALFRSWFVDNDNQLDNYQTKSLTDIAQYLNGLAMQKFPSESIQNSLPVLKIKELGQGLCDASSDRCSTSIKPEYVINDGDVIFSWSGTLLVDVWCGGKCGLNQHLFKVTSDNYPKWFIFYWTKHHLDKFIRIAKDKAVTMGHIKRCDLESSEVKVPEKSILEYLDKIFTPLFDSMITHRIENRKLSALRDTLLPKLMAGEIAIE
mgnify:CR=1 FL=1